MVNITSDDIKERIEQALPGADVRVVGAGCDLRITVICDTFESVLPVKRQQMVYSGLSEWIASGHLHAVTMDTFTQTEWAANRHA